MAVLPFCVTAQDLSVEDVYLQQSAELQVIRSLGTDNSRDLKAMALDYIGEIVDRGAANDEVRQILADLTMDGIHHQVRLNGRVINNFPDLRIRAINYLAELGTPEAKDSLLAVLELSLQATNVEEDPSVITAAIKGLSKIGLSDNGDTLRSINSAFLRFNTRKPDNALAQAVVIAIDSFIGKSDKDNTEMKTLMSINMSVLMSIQVNYEYIKYVRDNASAVITKLRKI
jgi:hypothetical protein